MSSHQKNNPKPYGSAPTPYRPGRHPNVGRQDAATKGTKVVPSNPANLSKEEVESVHKAMRSTSYEYDNTRPVITHSNPSHGQGNAIDPYGREYGAEYENDGHHPKLGETGLQTTTGTGAGYANDGVPGRPGISKNANPADHLGNRMGPPSTPYVQQQQIPTHYPAGYAPRDGSSRQTGFQVRPHGVGPQNGQPSPTPVWSAASVSQGVSNQAPTGDVAIKFEPGFTLDLPVKVSKGELERSFQRLMIENKNIPFSMVLELIDRILEHLFQTKKVVATNHIDFSPTIFRDMFTISNTIETYLRDVKELAASLDTTVLQPREAMERDVSKQRDPHQANELVETPILVSSSSRLVETNKVTSSKTVTAPPQQQQKQSGPAPQQQQSQPMTALQQQQKQPEPATQQKKQQKKQQKQPVTSLQQQQEQSGPAPQQQQQPQPMTALQQQQQKQPEPATQQKEQQKQSMTALQQQQEQSGPAPQQQQQPQPMTELQQQKQKQPEPATQQKKQQKQPVTSLQQQQEQSGPAPRQQQQPQPTTALQKQEQQQKQPEPATQQKEQQKQSVTALQQQQEQSGPAPQQQQQPQPMTALQQQQQTQPESATQQKEQQKQPVTSAVQETIEAKTFASVTATKSALIPASTSQSLQPMTTPQQPKESVMQKQAEPLTSIQRLPTEPKSGSSRVDPDGFQHPKKTVPRVEITGKPCQEAPASPSPPASLPSSEELTDEQIMLLTDEQIEEIVKKNRHEEMREKARNSRKRRDAEIRAEKLAAVEAKEQADRELKLELMLNLEDYKRHLSNGREELRGVQKTLCASDPKEYLARLRQLAPFDQSVLLAFGDKARPKDAQNVAIKYANTRLAVWKIKNDEKMIFSWMVLISGISDGIIDDIYYMRTMSFLYKLSDNALENIDRLYMKIAFEQDRESRLELTITEIDSEDPIIDLERVKGYMARRLKCMTSELSESEFTELPDVEQMLYDQQRYMEPVDPIRMQTVFATFRKICSSHPNQHVSKWAHAFEFLSRNPNHLLANDVFIVKNYVPEEYASNDTTEKTPVDELFSIFMPVFIAHVFGLPYR